MANTISYELGASGVEVSGLLARIRKAIADYRLYRATISELEGLNDRELGDLGVSRLSIRDIAYDSVYRA